MHAYILRPLLIVGLLALAVTTATPMVVPPAPIAVWIEQLGDRVPARRDEASRRLQRQGEAALPLLRNAARRHPQPRVRQLAVAIAARIDRGEILAMGSGTGYWFNRVAFTPDGRYAVVTGGGVIVMDLLQGKEVRRSLELAFARRGLALSADGKQFATGHQNDRMVRIGEVATGRVTHNLQGHTAGVDAVAFSPHADRLVSGGLDRTLRLWDLKTGKEIRRFPGITDQIHSVAYAADGKRIVSGHGGPGSDFAVRLWDADSGKELRRLKGHRQDVSAVFFFPDGKRAVSTGNDGAAIVWDLTNGKEVRRMTHPGGIHGAVPAPDGKRLLTAGFGDRTVRLWDLASCAS